VPISKANDIAPNVSLQIFSKDHEVERRHEYSEADETKVEEAATVAALETVEDEGNLVDTEAPVSEDAKVFSLHDFKLPISLVELQKYGGAQGAPLAFMARKQKIEEACGVQVPTNDGRRHSLTLTVNDYKRRRGLL